MAKYSIHLEDRSGYGGDILGERMSSSVVIDDLSSLVLVCLQGSVYCSIVLNLTLLLMQIHLFQFLPPLCSVMSLCGAPGLWHHVLLHCIMKGCDSPLSGTATWQCLSCNGVRVIKLTMSVIIRWLVVQVTLNLPGLNMQEC